MRLGKINLQFIFSEKENGMEKKNSKNLGITAENSKQTNKMTKYFSCSYRYSIRTVINSSVAWLISDG